jgi:hypothetical protein
MPEAPGPFLVPEPLITCEGCPRLIIDISTSPSHSLERFSKPPQNPCLEVAVCQFNGLATGSYYRRQVGPLCATISSSPQIICLFQSFHKVRRG